MLIKTYFILFENSTLKMINEIKKTVIEMFLEIIDQHKFSHNQPPQNKFVNIDFQQ